MINFTVIAVCPLPVSRTYPYLILPPFPISPGVPPVFTNFLPFCSLLIATQYLNDCCGVD